MATVNGVFPQPKQIIMIIHGYGVDVTASYRNYLVAASMFINRYRRYIDFIIACGGFPQKSVPRSEAAVIRQVLEVHVDQLPLLIIEEKNSLTTTQNLLYARKIIHAKGHPDRHRIVDWCDALAAIKIRYMLNRLFPSYCCELRPYDLSGHTGSPVRHLVGTVVDIAGFHLPLIQRLETALVKRRNANR